MWDGLLNGITASVVGAGLFAALVWMMRLSRARLERGSAGIWIECIFSADDPLCKGEIDRMDVVRQLEGIRGRWISGSIYRVYNRNLVGGIPAVQSYRLRGRASDNRETDYFWPRKGDGNDGVLLLIHTNRSEMQGEYVRAGSEPGSLPLERFPVRRVRVGSRKLGAVVQAGKVDPLKVEELAGWPNWVKEACRSVRSLAANK